MLELFRRNNFANSLLLLPYALLLRFLIFFDADALPLVARGILSEWTFDMFAGQGFWTEMIATILVFLQAAMLNRLVIKNRITYELSLYPGVFYILATSMIPAYNGLSSILISNTFILIAIGELFQSYKKKNSPGRIFNVGFWLGVAGLFFFGYHVLFLYGIIGLSSLRTLRTREWLQYLSGYLTAVLITGMLGYIFSGTLSGLRIHATANFGFLDLETHWSLENIIATAVLGVITLWAVLAYNQFTLKKNIHAKKKVELFYWLMLLSGFVLLIQASVGPDCWIGLAIPFGMFLGMYFLNLKSRTTAEFLHFLLLLLTLGLHVARLLIW